MSAIMLRAKCIAFFGLLLCLSEAVSSFSTPSWSAARRKSREFSPLHHSQPNDVGQSSRRGFIATAALVAVPRKAHAASSSAKSRTDGYAVQYTEREWAYLLSGAQYNILRQGGTERQRSSILYPYTAANAGTYHCAGCNTPLFSSASKFDSGTGWPSFSSALVGVEVEDMNLLRATLGGREARCATCGGHLGDLFNDGWIYTGTSAAVTGNRYCIDGGALIFQPQDYVQGGSVELVFGDLPPPNKVIEYQPSLYRN